MGVDWEQRIDFDRLRRDRLAKAKAALDRSHIGEWSRDKNARFVLLPRGGDPVLWDFGSAARHHQLDAPWLPPESFRGGVSPMRGAMPDATGVPDAMAAQIAGVLHEHGLDGELVGSDIPDMVAHQALA